MRLIIDMQGAQTASRFKEIGRYTMGLAEALVRNRGEHEVLLALNGMLSESIDGIREAFTGLLPKENIRVWYTPTPIAYSKTKSAENRCIALEIYSAFLLSLNPDVVLTTSMVEGWEDEYFCDISKLKGIALRSAVVHDFIPKKNLDQYLSAEKRFWYTERFETLSELDILLTNSVYTYNKSKEFIPQVEAISISIACNSIFHHKDINHIDCSVIKNANINKPFILYAGDLEDRENLKSFFAAFNSLPKDISDKYQVVILCRGQQYIIDTIKKEADKIGLPLNSVRVCHYISDKMLHILYNSCTLFVCSSIGEWGGLAVLEAMACGAPIIASNSASIPEVIDYEEAMFNPFDFEDISKKMKQALTDIDFRGRLIDNAFHRKSMFSWNVSAKKVWSAFEKHIFLRKYKEWNEENLQLLCSKFRTKNNKKKHYIANCITRTFNTGERPQLLVDIGDLAYVDAKTGIQRVIRSILSSWIKNSSIGYEIKPVYAVKEEMGYVYAHEYMINSLGIDDGLGKDMPIDYSSRDIFLGIALQVDVIPFQMPFLRLMHRHGVRIAFVVHDILAVQYPMYCHEEIVHAMPKWLQCIGEFDELISVSKATMNYTNAWMDKNGPKRAFPIKYSWFHLGSDIENSIPTTGVPKTAESILRKIKLKTSFLMVSTIEPRKGHRQTLSAFEELWGKGLDINLVIVGKVGWYMDDFIKQLKTHRENDKHLFWLEGISDEYLNLVYEASSAVLMASEGEGFGLAIVEGARHKRPLILRDIPVFRELAGEHAFYFSGLEAKDLSTAIELWIESRDKDNLPVVDGIECLTWDQSAEMLLQRLIEEQQIL